jgi:hypothetical protein
MIQLLATRYNKQIAYVLALIFCMSMIVPAYGIDRKKEWRYKYPVYSGSKMQQERYFPEYRADHGINNKYSASTTASAANKEPWKDQVVFGDDKVNIDGPSQPEMASFKSAGTNDMVNLFTGDFSYNIPLMNVGGYPINIFYSGGIGMEQEASWVGLGWNINPGTVNRNMRGVPDDFNGEDTLTQSQNMKKNVTWGVSLGGDLELVGLKELGLGAFSGSIGATLGYSVNNYLGPAIELGIKGTTGFRVGAKGISEKGPVGVSAGLSANLSSRSGLTLAPNVSLSANLFKKAQYVSTGVGVSTSYNSRTGIHAMQLSGQMSMNYKIVKDREAPEKTEVNKSSIGANIVSTTISFTKPSYVPSIRSVITNSSGAGRFQLGGAMFGFYGSLEIEGYGQVSQIESVHQKQEKPMVGYLYAEKAKNNRNAVMDFTRFNDQEVTPSTTIISAPQYSYDVFSIQGEGTGGSIRLYRNDNGYARDNYTASKDRSWSAGIDVGIPGHIGANFNTIKTPSHIGEWDLNNKLRNTTGFRTAAGDQENVYFRNPGESSVLHPNQYDSIGGTDLVRYKLSGTGFSPAIEPKLQKMTSEGVLLSEINVQRSSGPSGRKKRTQVVSFLTAEEASVIGLDTTIKNYDPNPLAFIDANNANKLKILEEIDRYSQSGYRKKHHISQVNVTEADGKRYIYGVPVYNQVQKDFTFTVGDNCNDCDLVPFSPGEASIGSTHISSGVGGKDGYTQITETPPYAHSFLLSGLLSPDYVDVNGDGITEDDLGTSVKFNYTKVGDHEWRTPLVNALQANSNPGNLSEKRDDKGILSYGKRESWYLHSIESKTMIAFFTLENRADGKGINGELGLMNYSDNSLKRLKQIDLYNKADLKKNGVAGAKPIQTVHFDYSYSLCTGTPDNQAGGKLTLERIRFTLNKKRQASAVKNQYVFSYTKTAAPQTGENPGYGFNASDRWGNYKPHTDNPQDMKNRDYPYSLQDKTKADQYAGAWGLKKILLPSGGQIEVDYESDDYAFVQNKRAAVMSEIIGFSNTNTNPTSDLYSLSFFSVTENDHIFIKVPEACNSKEEVYQKYLKDDLQGMKQLAIRLTVNMPKGPELLTSYASFSDYGVYTGAGVPAIWIKMNKVDGYSPLSQTAIEFLRQQLPGQAFPGFDVSEGNDIEKFLNMLNGLLDGIKSSFSRIPQYLRERGLAQKVQVNKSFVRLNDADGYKYGGGHRVKKVVLKDNWNRMTNQYGSMYGQEYAYSTKEIFNGMERTISSGVASYEPSIGGEENPFLSIVQISNDVPLGPTSYGAIEMPILDAFFPAPLVGYSKVTVRSIGKKQNPQPATMKTRSGLGRQVTEFYTAKDFPVYYTHTPLEPSSDIQEHTSPTLTFFYKYAFDSRAISQGFLVATNDMHGKMKSQTSYAENDTTSRIHYTENFYRNTGSKGLNEKFDFVHNTLGGEVKQGNMGIDIELMTDTREFSLRSNSFEIQAQVDWMLPAPFPVWLPFIWPVSSESENVYRAVTTTKVISYHAVLDSMLVIDKGSQVSTKNLVYDAETGQVVVNRTNNQFDKPVYSVNYPAYWAYSGMGLAYKNIDAIYSNVNFLDGKITSNNVPASIIESGDELYIINAGTVAGCDPIMYSSGEKQLIWALDTNKNTSSLTNVDPDFIFIDKHGKPYSRSGVKFRIVRSGKRNMLSAPLAGITLMTNPVDPSTHKLAYNSNSKIINASAGDYKEKWQTDNDVFYKYIKVTHPVTCAVSEVIDCSGYLEKKINPYRKGLLGNFRGYRNLVFYGERAQNNPTVPTNISQDGFLSGFNPYWNFNTDNNMVPDISPGSKWVWNSEGTRYNARGMELETKDALNIYTAAQYGYGKTLPVAIANNSRYHEMFYEGFEDYDYNDILNESVYNSCAARHVNFTGLGNSQIGNAEQAGFRAHTGKQFLELNTGQTLSKPFNITNSDITQYDLVYGTDVTTELYDIGGNHQFGPTPPNPLYLQPPTITFTPSRVDLTLDFSTTNQHINQYSASTQFNFYIEISTAQTYNFLMTLNSEVRDNSQCEVYFNGISITILDLGGNAVTSMNLSQDKTSPFNVTGNASVYLCPGIYKITGSASQTYRNTSNPTDSYNSYSWACTNCNSPDYKTLATQSTCTYTVPIPASQTMMNPTFSIPANKKMIFSAWVRDNCTTGAGTCVNSNQADILFNNGSSQNVTLKPSGPVIEGWQRYESEFMAPAGATQMELRLKNNSTQPIYFDDIRIHPFNSNMKSYVYDPVTLRMTAELDANNYARFYEYDEEGVLIRTKVETKQGVKTVTENRSARQKNISTFD